MNATAADRAYPLTPAQQGMLFHSLMTPGSGVYVQQLLWTLEEELELPLFTEAWRQAVSRHPALRTLFRWEGLVEPVQVVVPEAEVALAVHDLQALTPREREERIEACLAEQRRRGIDLTRVPNFEVVVFRMGDADHRVLWTYHHALLDGGARSQVVREVLATYDASRRGEEFALPAVAEYRELVDWLRRRDLAADEEYWRATLEGRMSATPVSFLSPAPAGAPAGPDGADREVAIPASVTAALRALAREQGVTLGTIVHAAWGVLLSRYSGEEDVVLGSTSACRTTAPPELAPVVGLRMNTLPLRLRVPTETPLADWLREVRAAQLAIREHEQAPLGAIQRWVAPSASRMDGALFETAVVFNRRLVDADLQDAPHRSFRLFGRTEFPLLLQAYAEDELLLRLEYHRTRVDDASAERMLGHLKTVLRSIAERPDQSVGELPLLTPGERDLVLLAGGETGAGHPFRPVHDEITEHARRTPGRAAIECEVASLTYSELDERATRLARRLVALGAGPESLVGLCVGRSTEMAVGMLGILKAGSAYVPIDPAYPPERTALILGESRVTLLVTQRGLDDALTCEDSQVVYVEDETDAPDVDLPAVRAGDLAYVMYTSGSTARPKGVMVTHGNLASYVAAMAEPLGVQAADRYLHTASIAFSSSVRQMMVPLRQGATVIVAARRQIRDPLALFEQVRADGVTVIDLVPSYARNCIDALAGLPEEARATLLRNRLRLVLSASEPLPPEVPATWRAWLGPDVRLINMFGQTETTGIATFFPIPADFAGRGPVVPIGRPIAGTRAYLLDEYRRPVPIGVPGEVHVAGATVGRGYLNQPELTEERFLPDPFSPVPGARMYRTGDRARLLPDGTLEFLGRRDRQVKIRGLRVELEEVEAALREQPMVRECVVIAREDAHGDQRLVAYVAGTDPALPVAPLREALAKRLIDAAVPSVIVGMAALPRLPNGKIDRASLPEADFREVERASAFVAPRTPVEEVLAGIWAEVLRVERVGATDNFFELGGHSLMATRVVSRIREALRVDLPLRVAFEAPTLELLAAQVEAARLAGAATSVPPLRPCPRGAGLPLSFPQERLWVLHQMEPENVAYNLSAVMRLRGALDRPALERTLREVVRRHEALRTVFPSAGGSAAQVVQPPAAVPLPVADLKVLPEEAREAEMEQLAGEEVRRPFDLARGPLFRALLLRAGAEEHVLVLTMHHIISDGWSRGVLYREVAALYDALAQGHPSPLPEPEIQYADFAAWQREWLQGDVLERSLAYWQRQLGGSLPLLDLPTDRPRPPMQSFRGATLHFALPAEALRPLRSLGLETNSTLFMTLLAAFQTLLHRYSGQDEVIVGSPIAGRTRVETEGLIGFFVNTLALRADLSGDPTFRDLLARVREVTLDAYAHQELPFEQLVDALNVPRDLSRSPLFQVMFVLQNTPTEPLQLPGLQVSQLEVDARAAKFDLTLSLTAREDGLAGAVEFNTDLFERATIDRMVGHFRTLLDAICEDPDRPISRLPILTEPERQRIALVWNDTGAEYARERCVHELIEEQAARTPEATALVHDGRTLTYRQLDERANQVANRLHALGVGPGTLVGVYMQRSLEMMVGLLGIHKAGGAYVPLDPAYPRDRVALMVEDSGLGVLLTEPRLARQLQSHGARLLTLDADLSAVADESTRRPDSGVTAADLAYVIYTSGSTGRPKGVMVEHRNVVNFFTGMDERVGPEPGTWLAVTSISFDISVLELFWTLARGFKVVIQGEDRQARLTAGASAGAAPSPRKLGFSLFYFASNEATGAGSRKYRLLMEGARFADRNGFEAVWTPERHFHSFGGLYPNPSVMSAAIAAVTERVKIRAGSVVLPLHSTIRVAEEWSLVDNLSDGRVGIAVASGWHDRDFVFAPENYADRRTVMAQQVETLRRLWRGESITARGGSGQEVEVSTLPRPVQPDLPIWVTAAGAPDTFRNAGLMGCNLLTHLLGQSVDQLREKLASYREAWREAGHPGEGHVTLMIHTFIGRDEHQVRETVRTPFREYLRTSVDLISKLAEGRGQDIRSAAFSPDDMEVLLDHAFDRYYHTSALLGTVESCQATVERLKEIGVDEAACLIDFGVDEELVLDSLHELAELRERSNPGEAATEDYSLPAQIRRHEVTHLQCTPSMATLLIAQPETRAALGSLHTLMIGGEAFPAALAAELKAATPAEIINMYGPTETTIWSSTHRLNGDAGPVPIGRPIANTTFHILDRSRQPVPLGVPGELYIGGDGVVRGYLNREELTSERFVSDPFGAGRLYRTGDLVRWREDGTVEFLGRTDHQVKIRGHRIELGEIEALLQEQPEVREAVVLAREDAPGDKRLVAYLVAQPGERIDQGRSRRLLKDRLPEYMVPGQFVVLDDLPRTPNAKIDRNALPSPEQVAPAEGGPECAGLPAAAEPATEIESRIAAVWKEILRIPSVGRQDNFFDLGGNSLLTIRVNMKLREVLQREIPLTDLFRFPTVRALAEQLGEGPSAVGALVVEAEAGTDRAELRRQALRRRQQLRS
jgi:natural product biosynthesis luciferase-like monooxygenase protein/amino acid adenylation domain-containing protein